MINYKCWRPTGKNNLNACGEKIKTYFFSPQALIDIVRRTQLLIYNL